MGYDRFSLEGSDVEVVSYTECFEKYCPIYMSYGLSYEDFWYGDVYKAKYQREAYKLKIRQQDEFMWEQGMYIYEAILQCSPVLHPFSKATKPLPYTDKPHTIEIEEQKDEKINEQMVENERLKAQIWLSNWVRSAKKHFENK